MTSCVQDFPGTIGYIESGHGHTAGLTEVQIPNKGGSYLDSLKAIKNGGILSALTTLPASADMDFVQVDLLTRVSEVELTIGIWLN